MGTTIPAADVSRVLLRDTLRDGLRAASTGLSDVRTPQRATSTWIYTAWPDRDRTYPLLVIEEAPASGLARIDQRAGLNRGQYAATIRILADNTTHLLTLRDKVREWLQKNTETLHTAGLYDIRVNWASVAWNDQSKVKEAIITVTGLIHTTTS